MTKNELSRQQMNELNNYVSLIMRGYDTAQPAPIKTAQIAAFMEYFIGVLENTDPQNLAEYSISTLLYNPDLKLFETIGITLDEIPTDASEAQFLGAYIVAEQANEFYREIKGGF